MITHKLILKESEELKLLLKDGDIVIPSLWKCFWPGLLHGFFLLIVYVCSMHGSYDVILLITGYSFFFFVVLSNIRSTYLCLPYFFRKKSKCLSFLKKKVAVYSCFYFLIITLSGLFLYFKECNDKYMLFDVQLYFFMVVLLSFVVSFAIFSIDVGRYHLSAFIAIISGFKERYKKESTS
ncbi:hypothetical protein AAH678_29955 [Sodalis endosymbiont of Spalangia cameroni]|uniref:hypothetical protein n=1 Tax=Sodalis praecaptivus TaxID=1239307 RepID=UPI0031F7BED7